MHTMTSEPQQIANTGSSLGEKFLAEPVLLLIVAGLLVRLAILPALQEMKPYTYDEWDFNKLALNLVRTGDYALEPGKPTSLRPPFYAFFVAGIYKIAGEQNFQAVRLVQIFLNVGSAAILYFLVLEIANRKIALVASALCITYPSLWGHCYMLLTEVLFTFLLILGLFCIACFCQRDRLPYLACGSILLGLAALTRSALSFLPVLFLPFLVCAMRSPWSRRGVAAGVFLVCFLGTLAPWVVRNTLLNGTFTPVDSSGGRILRWSINPDRPAENSSETAPAKRTEGQLDRIALRHSVGYILERPWKLILHILTNFFWFWRLERELTSGLANGFFGPVPKAVVLAIALAINLFYITVFLSGIFGILITPLPSRSGSALLLIIIAHICLIHSLVYGHSRYHLVVLPLLAVFSASFLVQWRKILDPQVRKRVLAACLICGVFLVSWTVQILETDGPALFKTLFGVDS